MHNLAPASATRPTCDTWRRGAGAIAAGAALCLLLALGAGPSLAAPAEADGGHAAAAVAQAQPAHEQPVPEPAVAEGHTAEEQHGASPWLNLAGKVVNFAILAGLLVYFLRQPLRAYLDDRGAQIRNDLVSAAALKEDAGRQIAEIDAKLKQLPGEIDVLRARGQAEIAAERARIEQAAAAERDRLLEQTRREIALQVRVARRDLLTHAADLSVQVARERIQARITDQDQRRLVDRYLEQVKPHE